MCKVISKNGIEMDPKNIECISKLATPTSCRKVRSFLGHAGYYRRFIEKISFISRPLHVLTQKEVTFVWTNEHYEAFQVLKAKLSEAPILQPLDWTQDFELSCDASNLAVGSCLGQQKDGKPVVIQYLSKALQGA